MINYRFLSYPSYLIAHNGSCDQQTYTIISFSHSLPAKSSVLRSANVVSHTWSCLHQPAFSLYNSPVPPSSELTTKTVQVHTCCLQSFLLFKTMFLLTRTGQKLPASFFFLPLENTASRKKKKKSCLWLNTFFMIKVKNRQNLLESSLSHCWLHLWQCNFRTIIPWKWSLQLK